MPTDGRPPTVIFLDFLGISKERRKNLEEQDKLHDIELMRELKREIHELFEAYTEEVLALARDTRVRLRYNVPPLTELEADLFAYKTAQNILLLGLNSVEERLEELETARKSR